jgi:sporulation protein YtfJ
MVSTPEHEIERLLKTAMDSLRQILDVNTIIGNPIEGGKDVTVVPVSRISCGFVAGGGEYGRPKTENTLPFAGGSGAGISLQPVAFLVMCKDAVRLIPVVGSTPLDKAIEAVPIVAEQLQSLFKKGANGASTSSIFNSANAATGMDFENVIE